ncbi:MAG TPA: hypothetical protein PLK55_02585 [archaeon]|jgi:hypothetical protein|nr:hypothetical protein [archaeon]
MNKTLKFILFFLLSYVLAQGLFYFLAKENFFTSPMYILLPVVAFFGLYFVMPMVEEYTKWNKWTLFILFIVISVLCYVLIVYIYVYQIYIILNNMKIPKNLEILKQLMSSSFLGFIVSGAIGIIAHKK